VITIRGEIMKLCLFLLLGLAAYAQRPDTPLDPGPCNFSLRVVDRAGRELPYMVDSFVRTGTNANMASSFRKLSAELPCGTYRYGLRRSDVKYVAGVLVGDISASKFSVGVTLRANPNEIITPDGMLAMSSFSFEGGVVRGSITGFSAVEELWLQLSSVTSDERLETRPKANGIFELWISKPDLFLLTVFHQKRVIASQLVEVGRPLVDVVIDVGTRLAISGSLPLQGQ